VSKSGAAALPFVDPKLRRQIEQFNMADTRLFRALNATLFQRIDRAIGFEKELNWLHEEKNRLHELCKQFIGWGDDKHRKALLEGEGDEEEEKCHVLMLDSPGFVKVLKERYGRKDPECHGLTPRHAVIHVPTNSWADATMANVILRHAFALGVPVAVPTDGRSFDYPEARTAGAIVASMTPASQRGFQVLAGAQVALEPAVLRGMVHEVALYPLVSHPVAQFRRSWAVLEVGEQLKRATGTAVSMETFLLQPGQQQKAWLGALSEATQQALLNPLNRQFQHLGPSPQHRAKALMGQTDKVLVAEHLKESLLFMSRFMCWSLEEIVFLPLEELPALNESNAKALNSAILALNSDDKILYDALNASLWRGIAREISFGSDLHTFKLLLAKASKDCQRARATLSPRYLKGLPLDALVRLVSDPTLAANEKRCNLMAMDPESLLRVLSSPQALRRRMPPPQPVGALGIQAADAAKAP
jgi:hypothetical protein